MAWLPSLTQLRSNRYSGTLSGKRSSIGGRAKVKVGKCLYLAAYTAATCNPFIFAHVQEPHGRCKPFKCALVAAMRKPLIPI